jgi:hypothetical protein
MATIAPVSRFWACTTMPARVGSHARMSVKCVRRQRSGDSRVDSAVDATRTESPVPQQRLNRMAGADIQLAAQAALMALRNVLLGLGLLPQRGPQKRRQVSAFCFG